MRERKKKLEEKKKKSRFVEVEWWRLVDREQGGLREERMEKKRTLEKEEKKGK